MQIENILDYTDQTVSFRINQLDHSSMNARLETINEGCSSAPIKLSWSKVQHLGETYLSRTLTPLNQARH